jgi:hypothetical protein
VSDRITRVREAFRAALVGGAIDAERAHLFPGEFPIPCAWVGLPTVRAQRSSTTLSVPIALLVDGAREEQLRLLDSEAARVWDALRAVRLDGVKANVVSIAPESFGPEGSTTRGLLIVAEIELATLTLCDAPQLSDTT